MAALDQLKNALNSVKTFWGKLSSKIRKLLIIGGASLLVAAIVITVVMNSNKGEYSVLFAGITSTEASEVYNVLQEKGVSAQMNSKGQVMVPTSQVENLIFEMQAEGYPKTAAPYDFFLTNISATTTDYATRQINIFQLQERIQTTLKALDNIKDAMVTISAPEQSNLAWSSNDAAATASVVLTLNDPSKTLSEEVVNTMKKLVAASIQNCKAEDVVVTDSATGIDLGDMINSQASYTLQQFDYERKLAKRAEDAVKTLYSPSYGTEGMSVAAAFTIDTDKMKEESKTFYNDEDGDPFITHFEEAFTAQGGIPAQGVVGEEDNTDVPDYVIDENATDDNLKNYSKSVDYQNSYVLRQIERGTAPIKSSSITLLLNEENFSAARQDEIAAQVSRATGISIENVVIGSMQPINDITPVGGDETPFYENPVLLMGIAGAALLLCMFVIVLPIMLSRRRKRKEAAKLRQIEIDQNEAAEAAQRAQAEIDMHKNKLKYEAEAQLIQDNSMTEEIRAFAKDNPEMTATLIRSLLKEEE